MSENFDTAIKGRLEKRRGEWQEIAKQSGVSHSWISKFMNGHIPNPGYATLVKLSAVLSRARKPAAVPAEPAKAEG